MHLLFFVFALGVIVAVPIHFISVEHTKLQERYGRDQGIKIGEIYGRVSGYLMFISLIGIWLSPQPRFIGLISQNLLILVQLADLSISLMHLIIFVPFFWLGAFLLYRSVSELSRKVSEAHRPEKVVATGIYTRVRHPQYLGFLLMHIGFSFLLSGLYALLSTPLILIMLCLFARKEETELTKEFGKDYEEYKRKVPMLIPRLGG